MRVLSDVLVSLRNCVKFIRKSIYIKFCIKIVVLNGSYSAKTQHNQFFSNQISYFLPQKDIQNLT